MIEFIKAYQRRRLFAGLHASAPEHLHVHSTREVIHVDSPEGPVEGWFFPIEGSRSAPTVIFAHGASVWIDHVATRTRAAYHAMGCNVLLPETRGYGRSAGSPTEQAITDDYTNFYDALVGRPQVDPSRMIFHGYSQGGALVTCLAMRRTPAAMILWSTFTSTSDHLRAYLGFRVPDFLIADPLPTVDRVAQLDLPLLVVHGTQDKTVPYEQGVRISQNAPNATLVSHDCDHDNLPDSCWHDVEQFLRDNELLSA